MLEYVGEIALHLFQSVSNLMFFVFVLAYTRVFKSLMLKQETALSGKAALILLFGLLSVAGTYNDLPSVDYAVADTRTVGVIAGGLVGGPIVGAGAGIIGAAHWLITGETAIFTSAFSTIWVGLLAGACHRSLRSRRDRWPLALAIGLVLESVHVGLLATFAPPWQQAMILRTIGLPMIIINAIGVAAFLAIFDVLCREREKAQGVAAELALEIANRTLKYLRQGLTPTSAEQTIKIIHDRVENLAAVAITTQARVLAFRGLGGGHHNPASGDAGFTESTRQALTTGEYLVVQEKAGIGCANPECPLASKVVVPLTEHDQVVGSLVLYKSEEHGIAPFEIELALGLGQLISTQLEASRGILEAQLRSRAEIKVLQAQINPHFLFNAINTIVYYCRKSPEKARELLLHLGRFYRGNTTTGEELVDLDTEVRHVDSYVKIELARFQGRLKVNYEIPPDCACLIPPLTLQPLVENAIKHGLYPRKKGGVVKVSAHMNNDHILLSVEDDGVGIDPALAAKVLEYHPGRKAIGLANVHARLKSLFGEAAGLKIANRPGGGTHVSVTIPFVRSAGDAECISG